MENEAKVLLNDELKSRYFNYQDTLLLADGTLITSDYDSLAITDIKTYINTNKDHFNELLGSTLRVEKVEQRTINNLIERLSSKGEGFKLDDETLSTIGSDAKKILQEAVSRGASDIRIELYAQETRIRCRVDGRMVPLQKTIPEYEYGNHLIGYLFNQLAIDTDGDFYVNKPNNGRIEIHLSTPDGKRETIWRISYIYARNKGGQAVLRWLNKDTQIPALDALSWEPGHVKAVRDFMNSASGACLIAGQVGSGKSTTIASALNEVKDSGRSINTIEDPVEFDIGVIQTSVRGDNDELNGLVKLLLRHDVDIEMHGEMRSKEGAMAVCRKAETGQLMLTTIHTSSAIGIAHTLNEQMGVPLALIGAPDLMKLWIYQTLVRSVCPDCALTLEQAQPAWSPVQLEQYQQWLSHNVSTERLRFKNPEGCSNCYEGEKNRTTLVEMLVLDDEDRQYILRKEYLEWAAALKQKGYKTVLDHANLKIARGEIDLFTASERVNGLFQKTTSSIYKTFF
ncbi:MAG: ATPase, T2SS/T4P/T4SS family [Pseudomonadota bacterium]